MRRTSMICVFVLGCFMSTAAWAAVPETLHYSGKLDTAGGAFTGTIPVMFALYDGADAASSFWSETQAVAVQNGRFHVQLGNKTTLSAASVDVAALHVGVTLGTDDEMARVPIASVPYALRAVEAGNAVTVGGLAPTAFAAASHSHALADLEHPNCASGEVLTSDGSAWICGAPPVLTETDPQVGPNTSNRVPKWDGVALVAGSIVDKDAKVGIGTASPATQLHIAEKGGGGADIGVPLRLQRTVESSSNSYGVGMDFYGRSNAGVDYNFGRILAIQEEGFGGNTDAGLAFYTMTDGALNSEALRISNTGNVGIGTGSPSTALEIRGVLTVSNTGQVGKGLIVDNDAGDAVHHHQGGASRWSLGFDTNSNALGESFTGFYVYSRLGVDKYLIHENEADLSLLPGNVGNVGIGTVSPSAKLEVSGDIKADGIVFPDGSKQTTAASGSAASGIMGAVLYIYNGQSCPSGWTLHDISVGLFGGAPVDACHRTDAQCQLLYIYNGQSCPSGWTLHDISVGLFGGAPIDACFRCQ